MGCSKTIKEKELNIPKTIIDKLSDTIVRIELNKKISTGFFMKINKNHNFLLTSAHLISQNNIDSKITIKIFYEKDKKELEKELKLDCNKRFIKSFEDKGLDVTLIEIIPEDNIPEDKYLYPD